MVDKDEDGVRRSLDAVDRHRNRLLIGVVVTGFLLVLGLMHGAQAIHSGSTTNFIHAVMIILGIWTTMMTLVVVIQITVMTRRILRAIELASRK